MTIIQSQSLGQTGETIFELIDDLKMVAMDNNFNGYEFTDKADKLETVDETIRMLTLELVKLTQK